MLGMLRCSSLEPIVLVSDNYLLCPADVQPAEE